MAKRKGADKTSPQPPAKENGTDRRRLRLIVAGLAVLTLAVYFRALDCRFLSIDDPVYITSNVHVQEGLTTKSISWAFTTTTSANWHPLTWLSHQLDCTVFGLKPWGHHLTAVLFHTASVALLFLALMAMTGAIWRSAFVAALFAVHPLHVESVAWVAERKDVLSTFFWMLTMLAYARYASSPNVRRYLLVALAFTLGLMSKPMLVSLPIVLLLLDVWPLGRLQVTGHKPQGQHPTPDTRHLILEKLPLFALALASCVVTYIVQQTGGAVRTADQYPIVVRAANAVVAYAAYIAKMVWPAKLSVFYPHPEGMPPVWLVIACLAGLAGATYGAIRLARSRPYVTMGWLWYLITLLPVIGLVQVGRQAMADRYTYIPLIGLSVIIAWGVPDLLARLIAPDRVRRIALVIAACAVMAASSVVTWTYLGSWRGPVEIFEHALRSTGGHYGVRYLLADALNDAGKPERAAQCLRETIRANPRFVPAYLKLGTILLGQGRPDQAMVNYEKALRMDPRSASAHTSLGYILLQKGDTRQGMAYLRKAIEYDPRAAQAHYNLAVAFDKLGDLEKATQHYRKAINIDPDMPDAHFSLATALTRQGRLPEAIDELDEAIRIKPDMPEAHFYMGYVLTGSNEPERAIPYFRTAIRLKPKWAVPHFGLANALSRTGDYTGAWKELHRSIDLGYKPDPAFLESLSRRMPEPGK